MTAYYNERDPFAAQWLRNLIAAGLIAPGHVDDRSIEEVRPDDLAGFTQCHFFAGVAGWSLALRLAGVPDARPVWTGSCPCQPFSAAGKGQAADDERHLWPVWMDLIRQCKPPIVFGEQVEAAIGWGWLDLVFADLEAQGYACGAAVLPACSVGAPHIRQRLWFVADNGSERWSGRQGLSAGRKSYRPNAGRPQSDDGPLGVRETGLAMAHPSGTDGRPAAQSGRLRDAGGVAYADGRDAGAEGLQRGGQHGLVAEDGRAGELGDASRDGRRQGDEHVDSPPRSGESPGFSAWSGSPSKLDRWDRAWDHSRGHGDRIHELGTRPVEYAPGEQMGLPGRPWLARSANPWSDLQWLPCTDGKARPTKPGIFPLAHGISRRVGKLRAAGNAIVPQVAAEFVKAAMN